MVGQLSVMMKQLLKLLQQINQLLITRQISSRAIIEPWEKDNRKTEKTIDKNYRNVDVESLLQFRSGKYGNSQYGHRN